MGFNKGMERFNSLIEKDRDVVYPARHKFKRNMVGDSYKRYCSLKFGDNSGFVRIDVDKNEIIRAVEYAYSGIKLDGSERLFDVLYCDFKEDETATPSVSLVCNEVAVHVALLSKGVGKTQRSQECLYALAFVKFKREVYAASIIPINIGTNKGLRAIGRMSISSNEKIIPGLCKNSRMRANFVYDNMAGISGRNFTIESTQLDIQANIHRLSGIYVADTIAGERWDIVVDNENIYNRDTADVLKKAIFGQIQPIGQYGSLYMLRFAKSGIINMASVKSSGNSATIKFGETLDKMPTIITQADVMGVLERYCE